MKKKKQVDKEHSEIRRGRHRRKGKKKTGGSQENGTNVLGVNVQSAKQLIKTLLKLDFIIPCFPESSF